MPLCMECTNSIQERRTRYPPPLASAKSRTTLSNTGLCLGHSHSLRDQTSPAVLLLPPLQQQVTLDFKYFIHFLVPTYLNISIYWVKPGRLPPGGSALASGKYQLEKNTSSRKTLGCISSTFPPVYCTPDTHTHTEYNKEQLQKPCFFQTAASLGLAEDMDSLRVLHCPGWLLGVIPLPCPITW